MIVTSKILARVPGLLHGFGSVTEPIPHCELWEPARPRWKQVHGTRCAWVSSPGEELGELDAMACETPGLGAAIITADCVPVLLARHDGRRVAAVHAGWRGSIARIVRETWALLAETRGEKPGDWVAAIGPAIGPCCYEVDAELADRFRKTFGAESGFEPNRIVPGRRILDLAELNRQELVRIGLAEVDCLRICTRCHLGPDGAHDFHSYRREKGGTRQYSIALLSAAPA